MEMVSLLITPTVVMTLGIGLAACFLLMLFALMAMSRRQSDLEERGHYPHPGPHLINH